MACIAILKRVSFRRWVEEEEESGGEKEEEESGGEKEEDAFGAPVAAEAL
jgi:hypothetical protein